MATSTQPPEQEAAGPSLPPMAERLPTGEHVPVGRDAAASSSPGRPSASLSASHANSSIHSYRQRAESLGQLPTRGTDDDVQSALQKLERIEKLKQSKRRWRRGAGLGTLPSTTSAVHATKNAATSPRRSSDSAYRRDSIGTPLSEKEAGDAESIASRTGRLGEVKLAIGSMPGLTTVMSKARRSRASSDTPTSKRLVAGADTEEETVPSSSIYGIIAKPSTARSPSSRRNSTSAPAEQKTQDDKSLHPPAQPATASEKSPRLAGGTGLSPIATGLDLVKEEETVDTTNSRKDTLDAAETLQRAGPAEPTVAGPAGDAIVRPVPQRPRPRLMIQSPTESGETSNFVQSPQSYAPPENALSGTLKYDVPGAQQQMGNLAVASTSRDGGSREQTPSPTCNDTDVHAVIEACERNMSRHSLFADEIMQNGLRTPSSQSTSSGTDSDVSDLSSDEEQQMSSLNLEHGNEMTARQKKKLLRRLNRDQRGGFLRRGSKALDGQGGNAEISNIEIPVAQRAHRRTGSISTRVATGLQYASSQSRNRRAMEKYSPHPSRPSSARPELPASLTLSKTLSGASSPRSLRSEQGMPSLTSASMLAQTSSNDQTRTDADLSTDDTTLPGTAHRRDTDASSLIGPSSRRRKLKQRIFSLKRGRKGPSDVLEEDDVSDHTPANEEDVDEALDQTLGKLAAEQAPDETRLKYEYDVLYENQRGMLFFGIPKFSSKTLLQWDPSPWTDAQYGNSVYNIANAQLPDPSWEWVHAEWMIDMSGDVDEAGWQYSFTFGRFSLPLFVRPQQAVPRANARGNAIMNKRFAKAVNRSRKIEAKEAQKEDDGIEALKRSAVARNAKWSSIPTQNSYVRRRRWIRLRVRKPLHQGVIASASQTHSPAVEKGRVFGDVKSRPLQTEATPRNSDVNQERSLPSGLHDSDDDDDDDASLSDFEEGSSSSSSLSEPEVEGNAEDLSGFYPKKTPGRLSNGRDPTELRNGKLQKRRRRHAREFTGTLRELKSLLPALMERKNMRTRRHRSPDAVQIALWQTEIDARNPFLSWNYIKRRLEDDDVAFATSSIRAREKRYASTISSREKRMQQSANTRSSTMDGMPHLDERYPLTKDALVEINFRRILRVLKVVKLDRQKLQLWRMWLGMEDVASFTDPIRHEDLIDLGLAASGATSSSVARSKEDMARLAAIRWRQACSTADPMDVWDVLERRLDRILMTFEYQSGRATLLRILLTAHAATHAMHKYRPGSIRLGQEGQASGFPADLSPTAPNEGEKRDGEAFVAGEEWRSARLPRLEFWSDLMATAHTLLEGTTAPLPPSSPPPPTSRPGSASPYTRSIPRARSPLHTSSRAEDMQAFDNFAALTNRSRTPVLSGSFGSHTFSMQPISRSSTPKLPGGALSNAPVPRRLSTTAAAAYSKDASYAPHEGGQPIAQSSLADMRNYTMSRGLSPAFEQRHDNAKPSSGLSSSANSGLGLLDAFSFPARQQGDFSPRAQSKQPSPRPSSDADRAFLAELLQLPPARQKDLVMRTSSLMQPLDRDARDQERSLEHKTDLALGSGRRTSRSSEHSKIAPVPQRPNHMWPLPEPSHSDQAVDRKTPEDAQHADQAMSLIDRLTQAAELES